MKNFKLLNILLILGLGLGLSACGSKDSRKAGLRNGAVRTNASNQTPGTNNVNTQYSEYGSLFNGSDLTYKTKTFLGLPMTGDQLGTVSGQKNSYDRTGIVLEGSVSVNNSNGNGSITLYIWDTHAVSTNQVIVVQMPFSGFTSNRALYFEDNYGGVILDGYVNNGAFAGTAYMTDKNMSNPQVFGQFEINAQAFFN